MRNRECVKQRTNKRPSTDGEANRDIFNYKYNVRITGIAGLSEKHASVNNAPRSSSSTVQWFLAINDNSLAYH